MSIRLPNGTTFALATTYGAAIPVTDISNASPGVASATAHGLNAGDLIWVTSGWSKLNDRILKVGTANTNDFQLSGYNTSDTSLYPATTGGGSVKEITAWQQIQQVTDSNTSGGEMQFTTVGFLENDFEVQLPTQHSPMTIVLTIADDDTLPGYIALNTAAEQRATRALKATLPGGSVILYNGYVSFNTTPSMTRNQVMAVRATFNLLSKPIRYAA